MEQNYINKSDFKILSDFAKSIGKKLEFSEQVYKTSKPNRFPKYRNEAYIQYGLKSSSYFVCLYDSFYRDGEFSVFSGAFVPVELPLSSSFNIQKKTILDGWSSFFGKKSFKTGNRNFDSKVVITGDDTDLMTKYISNTKFQHKVLEAFNIKPTIQISLNSINASFVPELKNKSQFCIYDKQEWILEKQQIKYLLNLIEDFNKIIT